MTLVIDCGVQNVPWLANAAKAPATLSGSTGFGAEHERRNLVEVAAGRLVHAQVLGDRDRLAEPGLHLELGEVGVHRLRGGRAPC